MLCLTIINEEYVIGNLYCSDAGLGITSTPFVYSENKLNFVGKLKRGEPFMILEIMKLSDCVRLKIAQGNFLGWIIIFDSFKFSKEESFFKPWKP